MSDKMNPKKLAYWKEGPGNAAIGKDSLTKEFVDSCGSTIIAYLRQLGVYDGLPSNAKPIQTDDDTLALLATIAGVGPKSATKLFEAGYTTVEQVLSSSHDELIEAGLSAANISLILEDEA